MVVDTFHVNTLQLSLLSGIRSDHSEFWCGYRGSFCLEYTFRSDCSHFKTFILLGAKLSSPTRCAWWEPEIRSSPKTLTCRSAASSARNSRLFCLFLHLSAFPAAPGTENTRGTSISKPVKCHYWYYLCESFQCHAYESLEVSSPASIAQQLGLQTIHVCTILSQRNYPSSVHLVRSLLSWLE